MNYPKIIFLDFDGVLVNRKSWYVRSGLQATADPTCVVALNRIIQATGAAIVVSSSWRIGTTAAEIRRTLRSWGVIGPVLGCTPSGLRMPDGRLYISNPRGLEIQKWLDEHSARFNIDRVVILDDESWDFGKLASRLVKSEFEIGLTEDLADRAIALLEGV